MEQMFPHFQMKKYILCLCHDLYSLGIPLTRAPENEEMKDKRRKARVWWTMHSDGGVPTVTQKCILFVLYIWIEEVGLLGSSEQGGEFT